MNNKKLNIKVIREGDYIIYRSNLVDLQELMSRYLTICEEEGIEPDKNIKIKVHGESY
jgi:hypothetical protein